jgi:hypothetical protein
VARKARGDTESQKSKVRKASPSKSGRKVLYPEGPCAQLEVLDAELSSIYQFKHTLLYFLLDYSTILSKILKLDFPMQKCN